MRRGFTLIELLIVIGISAVLLAVGVLSLNRLRSGNAVEIEAQQLVAVLRSAQEKAIGQDSGSRWGVYFDIVSERNFYSLYEASTTINITVDTHTLKTGMLITLAAPVTSTIIFDKVTGRPEASTTITISDGNPATAKSVIITAQGRISYE